MGLFGKKKKSSEEIQNIKDNLPSETNDLMSKLDFDYNDVKEIISFNDYELENVVRIESKMYMTPVELFITRGKELDKDFILSFGYSAERVEYNSLEGIVRDRAKRKIGANASSFTLFILDSVNEEDLPSLLVGDLGGYTNRTMLYDIGRKYLYGRNGSHMMFFKKKFLKDVGVLEDCNNNKYFKVNIL
jgi:hypothetical protein